MGHSPQTEADLTNRFTYHPPTAEQPEVYGAVRDCAHLFALLIEAVAPDSREKSLAFTHIEDAVMWANAAVARHGLRTRPVLDSGATVGEQGPVPSADDAIRHAITRLREAKPHTPLLTTSVVEPDEQEEHRG